MRSSEIQIFVYSNLLLNCSFFEKLVNTRKLRLIHSFPMIYHVHKSDKRLENEEQTLVENCL
jgi:hypothetical protein